MGTIKIKKDGEWIKLPNYGVQEFPDAPSDDKMYGRKNTAWVEFKSGDDKVYLNDTYKTESNRIIFSYAFTQFLLDGDYSILENATNEDYEQILGCTIQEFSEIVTTKIDAETTIVFPVKLENSEGTSVASINSSVTHFNKTSNTYTLVIVVNELDLILQITRTTTAFSITVVVSNKLDAPEVDEYVSEFSSVFGISPVFLCMSASTEQIEWNPPLNAMVKLHYPWLKPSFFTLTLESTDTEIKTALGSTSSNEDLWKGFKYFSNFGTFESASDTSNMKIIHNEFVSFSDSYRMRFTYTDLYNADRNTTVNIYIDCDKTTNTFSVSYYNKTESPLIYVNSTEPTTTDGKDGDIWVQYNE